MVHIMFQHETKSDLNPRTGGLFYVVGGEPLRLGPREFCLITGLRFGKWDGEVPSLESKFKDRVFGGRRMKLNKVGMKGTQKISYMDDFLVALRKKKYKKEHNLPWMNYSLPGFAWASKPSFRSKGINPNEMEVDEEWWVESIAFLEQQQKESFRESVRGKGNPIF
ncbi:hypothetical protein L1987_39102 [Smallanthus sonchifolius]|uniref:Uncharacterized protein n=1 Tax=Smallanthus sonchifolius TaxID=185202 RepID=A0ACB9HLS3_9ASTR|nr:hypothetical protein L1987_39102 [Smallanthus sonchifolius]